MWFMFVIPFVVFFVVFLVIATNAFKVHKNVKDAINKEFDKEIKSRANETVIFVPTQTVQAERHACEYCGSEVNDDDKKCNSCGARIKRRK